MGNDESNTPTDSQGDDQRPTLEIPTTDISELIAASSGAELATRLWERIERRFEAVSSATRDVVTGRSSPAWLDLVMAGTALDSMRDIEYVMKREEFRNSMIMELGKIAANQQAKEAKRKEDAANLGKQRGTWQQWPWGGDKDAFDAEVARAAKDLRESDPYKYQHSDDLLAGDTAEIICHFHNEENPDRHSYTEDGVQDVDRPGIQIGKVAAIDALGRQGLLKRRKPRKIMF